MRALLKSFLVPTAIVLAGCTTVRIENADVVEEKAFGVSILKITPKGEYASIIQTSGIGLILGAHHSTFGYLRETIFTASDTTSCRTLIVVETAEQLEALKRALTVGSIDLQLCLLKINKE